MKLKVTCKTCGKTLVQIDKPQITQDDLNTYTGSVSCDDDGSTNVELTQTP
jgi:hypothetical protein